MARRSQTGLLLACAAALVLSVAGEGTFKFPTSCTAEVDCLYEASWAVVGDKLNVTLRAKNDWVALGFASSKTMRGSDILVGYVDSNTQAVAVTNRHASGYTTPSIDSPNVNAISDISGSRVGDYVTVSFKRLLRTGGAANRDVDLSTCTPYYFHFVHGPGDISEHGSPGSDEGPVTSTSKINVCADSGSISGSKATEATDASLAHGCLMIAAWVGLSPFATFLARYMKVPLGARWFQGHRGIQGVVVLLTAISAIVIFSKVDYETGTHQSWGIAILVLAGIQTLLGVFRNIISDFDPKNPRFEGDHGPRRWLFNLLHWIIGRSLLVLAIVPIHLGMQLVDAPDSAFGVLYAWAAICILLCAVMEVLTWRLEQANKDKENDKKDFSSTKNWVHFSIFFMAISIAAAVTIIVLVAGVPRL